ncbi:hypothetical protein BX666DRAFT_2038221 [Dichotomocladium elegans]|nr:hypothetical protein BX666DRAFT_2038221 [Dichotomocladium elegans]
MPFPLLLLLISRCSCKLCISLCEAIATFRNLRPVERNSPAKVEKRYEWICK